MSLPLPGLARDHPPAATSATLGLPGWESPTAGVRAAELWEYVRAGFWGTPQVDMDISPDWTPVYIKFYFNVDLQPEPSERGMLRPDYYHVTLTSGLVRNTLVWHDRLDDVASRLDSVLLSMWGLREDERRWNSLIRHPTWRRSWCKCPR